MNDRYIPPSWQIEATQVPLIRKIVRDFAAEYELRVGMEYRPYNFSAENPILIQEFFRLFLTPNEIIWEGALDPNDDYDGQKTLINRIRDIVPKFASKQAPQSPSLEQSAQTSQKAAPQISDDEERGPWWEWQV